MSDEITKNSDEEIIQENTDVNKLLDMKYYSYLAYLSYFLLILNTVIVSENAPLYYVLIPLGTVISFSIYIYLRKNDERFEFLFLKNFNMYSLLQVCLLIPLLFYSFFLFIDFEFLVSLVLIPFWLVFFSLSFEEVESEEEKSVPPLSLSKKIFKFALNFLAFIFFCIFYMMISYPGNWIDSDTYHTFSIVPAWFCIVCIYFARRIK